MGGSKEQDDAVRWRTAAVRIDTWLVPVAFAMLSVLVLAQLVCALPNVRAYVDQAEGRFVQVSSLPVRTERANLTLYLSPVQAHSDVQVLVNGRVVGEFSRPSVTVSVTDGARITVRSIKPHGDLFVSVDYENPDLMVPAPGQTFELSRDDEELDLPTVNFASTNPSR